MMFQQEYPYEIFDIFQNDVVSDFDDPSWRSPISSSIMTFSSSIAEQQSHLTEKFSSLKTRYGSSEESSNKRRRRRRAKGEKKIEDKENQRMNHIAVERNRRKEMNHLLTILKSMMPLSYSQRSDQASIIEGAINYLKKQEQLLQSLEAKFKTTKPNQSPNIFSGSSSSSHHHNEPLTTIANVEVAIAPERHANIRVSTKTRPRLLSNIIKEFNSLGLSTLHINFTTSKDMCFFSFSVKVEEGCQLTTTVDEVAKAVHEVLRRIHKQY